jgi:hypothetical protein
MKGVHKHRSLSEGAVSVHSNEDGTAVMIKAGDRYLDMDEGEFLVLFDIMPFLVNWDGGTVHSVGGTIP